MVLGIPRWKPLGGHQVLFGNPFANPRSRPPSGLQVEKKEKKTPNGHQMVFHNSRSK
jgi:hypothetical protein